MADRSSNESVGETDARAWIISLSAVILALGLFYVASRDDWLRRDSPLQSVVSQVAGLVVATGLLSVAWELIGKRRFAAEVLSKARLSTDVVEAGITRVTNNYLDDVEWEDLFDDVTQLDIVVAYARTWRNAHISRLQGMAKRSGTRIRVFLPDPDDTETMVVLAKRFSTTVEDLQKTVREALEEFSELAQPGGGEVCVYVRSGDAMFSCYVFDKQAVLTLYSHGQRRTPVPTLGVRGGTLYRFVADEVAAIEKQSEQVFPAKKPKEGGEE